MSLPEDVALELREEIKILKQALKEAGDFAMRRLPHDAREQNASSEYFQTIFMQCAVETINSQRSSESEKTDSTSDIGTSSYDNAGIGTIS